jgi:hypothetical protein
MFKQSTKDQKKMKTIVFCEVALYSLVDVSEVLVFFTTRAMMALIKKSANISETSTRLHGAASLKTVKFTHASVRT